MCGVGIRNEYRDSDNTVSEFRIHSASATVFGKRQPTPDMPITSSAAKQSAPVPSYFPFRLFYSKCSSGHSDARELKRELSSFLAESIFLALTHCLNEYI
jgi:hypothetical protein